MLYSNFGLKRIGVILFCFFLCCTDQIFQSVVFAEDESIYFGSLQKKLVKDGFDSISIKKIYKNQSGKPLV